MDCERRKSNWENMFIYEPTDILDSSCESTIILVMKYSYFLDLVNSFYVNQ